MSSATSVMSEARAFLAQLREEIQRHPGVGHSLLSRMHTDPRTKHDFRILATQHYPLVASFCSYMEVLLLRAPGSDAKCWLAKVLVDEYGERSAGQDHSQIYQTFMQAAGLELSKLSDYALHPAVTDFIREHYRIVTEEPFLVGLGALGPGHEWAIPTMFEHVITGLKKAGFNDDEIEYWTCHLEQDQDHGAWLEEALADYCTTPEAQDEIRRGAMLSLDARERFWWGVLDKIDTELTKVAMPKVLASTLGSEASQVTFRQFRKGLKVSVECP